MARAFDGLSNQYLSVDVAPLTTYPFTFGAWVLTTDATATVDQTVMWLGNKAVNNHRHQLMLDVVGDVNFFCQAGGTSAPIHTTTLWSLNTWHLVCGVATSATNRAVFLDAGGKATTTTSMTPTGLDRYSIGMRRSLTPTAAFTGQIDRVFLYNVALTDAEVAALYACGSPLQIRRDALVDYRKLGYFSPEPNWVRAGTLMTVVGPTQSYGTPGHLERSLLSSFLLVADSSHNDVVVDDVVDDVFIDSDIIVVPVALSETASLTVSESASVVITGLIPLTAIETASLSLAEVSSLTRQFLATETASLTVAESASVVIIGLIPLTATELASLSLAEVSSLTRPVLATETASLTVGESASVVVTGLLTLTATETTSLSLAEAVSLTRQFLATETVSLTVGESASVVMTGLLTFTATETASLSLAEVTSLTRQFLATETASLHVAEVVTLTPLQPTPLFLFHAPARPAALAATPDLVTFNAPQRLMAVTAAARPCVYAAPARPAAVISAVDLFIYAAPERQTALVGAAP